jgi:hypothetical protein
VWPAKGVGVAASEPMLLGSIRAKGLKTIQGLVYTMALSGMIISSSKLIHERFYGHHNHISRMMRVIYVAPSRRNSVIRVSHIVKLNPSRWNTKGHRGIHHNNAFIGIGVEEEGMKEGI